MKNIIRSADSYKASHYLQFPKNTTGLSAYIEARGLSEQMRQWFGDDVEVVHFGTRKFVSDYLSQPITADMIAEAYGRTTHHGLPFNYEGWHKVLYSYNGYLPLTIQSFDEGTVLPVGTPQVQVYSTDPELYWLVTYIETALLRDVWYGSTVATIAREMKKKIAKYMDITGTRTGIEFKLHDFGARGASSSETAALGGMAHMLSFSGTDNQEAIDAVLHYYGDSEPMPGYSIPAAEHSTITSWGRANELAAYENMLEQFSAPGKIVAVVSDSYDIYNAVSNLWGEALRDKIINSGGTLVIRPDSGNPSVVVLELLSILATKFGYTTNPAGYNVLPPYLRIIQGDGMNPNSMEELLKTLVEHKWAIENISFGMGGGLLQNVTRDSLKYAMKASAIQRDNKREWEPIYKDPVTDPGKVSKKGIQALSRAPDGKYRTSMVFSHETDHWLLKTIYSNGYHGTLGTRRGFAHARTLAAV